MMYGKFHKSRAFAIFKSLATSPLAICLYNYNILFYISI